MKRQELTLIEEGIIATKTLQAKRGPQFGDEL